MQFRRGLTRLVSVAAVTAGAVSLTAAPVGAATAGTLTVTAVDFQFGGVGTTFEAGKYKMTFTNNGTAPHEIVVFKLAPDFEYFGPSDVVAAVNASQFNIVDRFAGAAFASPGDSDKGILKLRAPGVYAYLCFVGFSPEAPEDAHFNKGMVGTFAVTPAT